MAHHLASPSDSPPVISLDQPLLTFAALARHVAQQFGTRRTAPSTCWRWHRAGCIGRNGRRVFLPAIRVGGTYVTSMRAAEWFFAQLAAPTVVQPPERAGQLGQG